MGEFWNSVRGSFTVFEKLGRTDVFCSDCRLLGRESPSLKKPQATPPPSLEQRGYPGGKDRECHQQQDHPSEGEVKRQRGNDRPFEGHVGDSGRSH